MNFHFMTALLGGRSPAGRTLEIPRAWNSSIIFPNQLSPHCYIHAAQSCRPGRKDEHVYHRQGVAIHEGGHQLHEKIVRLSCLFSRGTSILIFFSHRYPEELADQSFDNTGLLLEAPFDPIRRQMNSVLLTIDLTKAVADEAIERKDCVVVSYRTLITIIGSKTNL